VEGAVRRDANDPNWETGIRKAVHAVLEKCIALGGSITAEHGVGILRRDDMPMQFDEGTLDAMRALKRAWDPQGILNPGKVFPSP